MAQLKTLAAGRDEPATDAALSPPALLMRLKGVGPEFATVLSSGSTEGQPTSL
jgi:hypothetical protein